MTADQVVEPRAQVAEDDEPRPGRHFVFVIVSLALLMSSVDQTIVATALGSIQHDLHTRLNWSTWTITVYALGRVIVLPIAGRISDLVGRRRIFFASVAIFTVASLGCGLANDIYTLIILRGIQALGGGGLMPSATGIIADQYRGKRDRAIASFMNINALGGIVGPSIGGVLVTYWSWRAIFFVNIPIGIVVLVLTLARIPETKKRSRSRLDVSGAAIFGTALLAAMFAVSQLGNKDISVTSPLFLVAAVLAVVVGGVFLRHSARTPHAIIPTRLIRGRGFAVMNSINLLWGAAMLGFGALVPVYAQDRFHIATLAAGTLLSARAIGIIVVTGLATLVLHRTGYRRPILFGFLVGALGQFMMSLSPQLFTAYTWLAIGSAVTGVGMGVAVPASNVAVLSLAPDEMASIAGLRAMFRQCGGIIGVAIVSAVAARSSNPGHALSVAFLVFAIVLVGLTPLVFRIPERERAN